MSYRMPASQRKLSRMKASPLPGRGPWRILPECPALLHNTASAATRGPRQFRCVCPHGLWHLANAQAQSRNWHQAEAIRKQVGAVVAARVKPNRVLSPDERTPSYMGNVVRRMPDLYGGECMTPDGRRLADKVLGPKYNGQALAVERHKEMCARHCKRFEDCLRGVLAAETPGGSWGGVYGAMDADEREKLWSSRQEQEQGDAA